MASTKINCRNETDITVAFTVTWALTLIGEATVQPDQMSSVGTEWVWYDVWAKNAADGKPLAHKAGVYGNSTVVLEKQGNRHILI